ncbi:hypothetical protein LJC20_03510 [Eubacteriales bacterium OttesenSCG-928-M02]|nr:hypothetical protein [Eubacteriales bacterium OttesenSCG-928-M02]
MKKVLGLLLAMMVLLSFPMVVFAEGEEPPEKDVTVLIPDDPNNPKGDNKPAADAGVSASFVPLDSDQFVRPLTQEEIDASTTELVTAAEALWAADGDEFVNYDDASSIGYVYVDPDDYIGPAVFSFVVPDANSYDSVSFLRFYIKENPDTNNLEDVFQLFDSSDVWYDEATGTWNIVVENAEQFSEFIALIERGVDPAEAAKIVKNNKSPKTADNGPGMEMLWVVFMLATVVCAVSVKKARA